MRSEKSIMFAAVSRLRSVLRAAACACSGCLLDKRLIETSSQVWLWLWLSCRLNIKATDHRPHCVMAYCRTLQRFCQHTTPSLFEQGSFPAGRSSTACPILFLPAPARAMLKYKYKYVISTALLTPVVT